MRKKIIFILTFLLLLTACAGNVITAPELLEPIGVTSDTAVAVRGNVYSGTLYNAYVTSYNEALFFTKNGFKIKDVNISEGDYVKKGDVLVTLDTTAIDEQITNQLEYINDLKIQNSYKNKIKEYDILIASLELASLRGSGASSGQIKQKEYSFERLKLDFKHQQETQEIELQRQNQLLNQLLEQLNETSITAPFDGRIIYMAQFKRGNTVSAHNPLIYIADESKLYVKYTGNDYIRASYAQMITGRINDRTYTLSYIPMSMDEYMKYIIAGNNPTFSFDIVDMDSFIEQGQFVSVYVMQSFAENVITIPVNAIFSGEAEEGVYVYVMEDKQKILRKVEIGLKNDSLVEIKSGLLEGDEVFVKQ